MANRFDGGAKGKKSGGGKGIFSRIGGAIQKGGDFIMPEKAEDAVGAVAGGLKTPVNVLLTVADKPGQAVRTYLKEGSKKGGSPFGAELAALRALVGKEHTTFTEAASAVATGDEKKIKKLPFGVETLGSTLTAPDTFLSLGSSAAAKQGLKVAARELGEDVAKNIAKSGAKKALSTAERAKLKRVLRREIYESGGAKTAKAADKRADKMLTQLDRSGQGGLKVAGRTVVGKETAVGKAAAKASPKRAVGDFLQGREWGRNLKGTVIRDTHLRHAHGQEAADELLREVDNTGSRVGHMQDVTDAAARRVAKGADMSDPELRRTVLAATDIASENQGLQGARAQVSKADKVAKQGQTEAEKYKEKLSQTLAKTVERQEKDAIGVTAKREAMQQRHSAIQSSREEAVRTAQINEVAARTYHQQLQTTATRKAWLKASKDLDRKMQDLLKLPEKHSEELVKFDEKTASRAAERRAKDAEKIHEMTVNNALLEDMRDRAVDRSVSSQITAHGKANTPTVLAGLRESGQTQAAEIVDFIDQQRRRFTEAQRAAGLGDDKWDALTGEYVPRYLTKEGRKLITERKAQVAVALGESGKPLRSSQLAAILGSEGHNMARTLRPDLNISQINNLLRDKGLLKEGENFFDDNALSATVRRAHQADAAVEHSEMLSRIAKIKDKDGVPLLREVDAKYVPEAGEEGLDLLGTVGKKYVTSPEVAKVLNDAAAVLYNDESLKAFSKNAAKVTAVWRSLATFGPAFHARNAAGNFWLNWLGGVKNPAVYAEAGKIQHALREVFQTIGKDGDFETALRASSLTPRERRLVSGAFDRGVIDRGFFHTDLPRAAITGEKKNIASRALSGANRANRATGSVVENNARLAHYIHKLGELGDADAAADSVKKYLFDYGALTATERHKFKTWIPFYTFMRKNTPLEIEKMLTQPGKFTALAGLEQDFDNQGISHRPDFPVAGVQDVLDIATAPSLKEKAQAAAKPLSPFIKFIPEQAAGHSSYNEFTYRGDKDVVEAAARNFIPPYAKLQSARRTSPLSYLLGLKRTELPAPEGPAHSGNRFDK